MQESGLDAHTIANLAAVAVSKWLPAHSYAGTAFCLVRTSKYASWYEYLPSMFLRMREDAGLTQRDLAIKLKTSQPWVHKSEIGERRVDIAEFMDWCLGCGIEPERALRELREQRGV